MADFEARFCLFHIRLRLLLVDRRDLAQVIDLNMVMNSRA